MNISIHVLASKEAEGKATPQTAISKPIYFYLFEKTCILPQGLTEVVGWGEEFD